MAERLIGTLKQGNQILNLYESTDHNPEIHIDGAQGFLATGHTAKLNLFTIRMNSTDEVQNRDVACRLVMGIDTFLSLADFLHGLAEQMKKDLNIKAVKPN